MGMDFNIISVVVLALLGVLWCFFGLKLVRVWAGIFGLLLGVGLGAGVASQFELERIVVGIIGIAVGVILACLGAILYRVGIFVVAFAAGSSLIYMLVRPSDMLLVLACLGGGLVIALLTAIHAELIIMIVTGVYGAAVLGTLVSHSIPVDGVWVQVTAIAVFAILGIWVQVLLESGKRKKQNLKKAEEIREQHSTENEVEKARALIENLDELPEETTEDTEDEDADITYID